MQSLTDTQGYYRAQLQNKLCNYASEISPHMNVDNFKKMVSGEPMEARLPYRDPITITDYAKFIFNTNTLPRDVEQSDAFFRRFLIVHFAITIPETEMDRQLSNRIIASELPGVFNWVLEGLQRLLKQQSFTDSAAVKEMVAQYRKESDSVQLFLEEHNYRTSSRNAMLLKDMYREYNEYCRESNYRPVSNRVFSERLKKVGYLMGRSSAGTNVMAEK
ncbi:MAG: hypothetical protein EOP48_16725 [Sphingobacteriales bacterium]|nr:MAG: hypothetical protein EOP48_16725 [Sphingobacteriales bacterium]